MQSNTEARSRYESMYRSRTLCVPSTPKLDNVTLDRDALGDLRTEHTIIEQHTELGHSWSSATGPDCCTHLATEDAKPFESSYLISYFVPFGSRRDRSGVRAVDNRTPGARPPL